MVKKIINTISRGKSHKKLFAVNSVIYDNVRYRVANQISL